MHFSPSKKIGALVVFFHVVLILFFVFAPLSRAIRPKKTALCVRTVLTPKIPTMLASKPAPIAASKTKPSVKAKPQASIDLEKTAPSPLKELEKNLKALEKLAFSPVFTKEPLNLPKPIEIAFNEAAPLEYGEALSLLLKNSLVLPEQGEVSARITLNAEGAMIRCEILSEQSQKNSEFLKKRLQEILFPCFNGFNLNEAQIQFTITFRNLEDS